MNDFKPLFDYIEQNIENKLDLKELSDFMGYSPYYISRKFMSIYGIPITGYVRIRKLQYSINDLLDGMKVIDVAMKYSFESHEGFTRSFENLFGSSPKVIKNYLQKYELPKVGISESFQIFKEDGKMVLYDDMHKMIFTILSNSFFEMKAGFCSKIDVQLMSNNSLRIFDDGRGIKLDSDGVVHEEVLNNLFSGKPITKVEYSLLGDLPLDDLKIVNSLCEKLCIKVWRNGVIYQQDYIRGIPQHSIIVSQNDSDILHGTEITLKPDSTIFENILFNKDLIQNWVKENHPDFIDNVNI